MNFVLRQVFDQLHLVILVLVSHELDGFFPRQLEAFQRIVGLDHLLHFLLDLQKILIVEFMLHIKVIIKPLSIAGPIASLASGHSFFTA